MNIAVLTGGSTPERDVALAGAGQVVAALRGLDHDVTTIDTTSGVLTPGEEHILRRPVPSTPPSNEEIARFRDRELGPALLDLPAIRAADVVFLALHGRDAEGGTLQAMLDAAGIPYTGSGALGSAIAMDKDIAKRLFRAAGIPTPDWLLWPAPPSAVEALGLPLVVKPSKVGSTIGLSVVDRLADVADAVAHAHQYDDEVILEAFVDGPELTVGILGREALGVGEIRPAHTIFDYECKYTPGMCEEIFPAPIHEALAAGTRDFALRAHLALKLRDYSRIDFRVGADDTLYCLEANTLPGLTATSLLPQSADAAGIPFGVLCERIAEAAAERRAGRNNARPSVINQL